MWWLFPGRCLLCERNSGRTLDLCAACERALPPNHSPCRVCALPATVASNGICARCTTAPPPFERTVAPFLYAPPLIGLIAHLKNGNGMAEARVLGALFADHARCLYSETIEGELPDVIVPVPLSYQRRMKRGYNQAALLASRLGRTMRIPVDYRSVRRVLHTPAQRRLSRSRRQTNLARAFQAKPLEPLVYALVDDVMTTGATARAVARCMLDAGAAAVHVWVTARTPIDTLRGS